MDPIPRAKALQFARAGIIVDKGLAEALIAQAHDVQDGGHGRLLDQAARTLKRTIRIITAVAAVRSDLSPDDAEYADELVLLGQQFF
ncbi:MAG TPA: hypothetical protein VGH74_15085 [Planctomycetaceae bacterium]